ncbi:MAG: phosphoribosylformylglycinamidine cyclo-ligase [Chloroflexi bacterium]|nr:phosphoribosylformylglycinamidine cyclo-ligase [Chloroflexota bacterium]
MAGETYAAAGVDPERARRAKELLAPLARSTFTPQVMGDVGFFGGLFRLQGYRDPVLVSSTDGVGTKLKLATLMGRYDTVGVDLVNQSVNDVLVAGATPLFFLDYIAMGRLQPERVAELVRGMAEACRAAGCVLIGGETAEMPGVYQGEDVELVGFVVGAVERDEVLDGSSIQEGDALLGLASSGPHTNGYSLIRRVFELDRDPSSLGRWTPELGCALGDALLAPHRAYYPLLVPALPLLKGMAHITGGGLSGNLPRVLPAGLGAQIDRGSWEVLPLFRLIQKAGGVSEEEMFRVFNMGVGMVLVCSPDRVDALRYKLPEAWVLGKVVRQESGPRLYFKGA